MNKIITMFPQINESLQNQNKITIILINVGVFNLGI